MPADLLARLIFCNSLIDVTFLYKVLFADEATFPRCGVFNWKNSDSWEQENLHLIKKTHSYHELSNQFTSYITWRFTRY